MLDIAARTGSDEVVGLVEDAVGIAPEVMRLPVRPMRGTTYRVTRRTQDPEGGFRDVNEGIARKKSKYVQEVKSMHFLDVPLEVDEAIVKGDDGSIGDILVSESAGAVRGGFRTIGSQIFYGKNANSKGFVGLESLIEGNDAHDITTGGTTNSTSAYLVQVGIQNGGVHLTVGNDGDLEMKEWMLQQIVRSNNPLMAFVSNLSGYIGLAVNSALSVYRVRGIDATNKLTDADGAKLLAKVPVEKRDNLVWFMNRTAAWTLQDSRSAVGQQNADSGGRGAYPPMPTELQGVPIVVTDSLVDTETAAAA